MMVLSIASSSSKPDKDLVGWWGLTSDAKDSSPQGNHGTVHSVVFSSTGALFDGQSSFIEIPHHKSLNPGKGDYTLSAWVHTEDAMDDLIGDIASKYDPRSRKGYSLGVLDNAGVSSGHSNHRNLFFGTDSGQEGYDWRDCGRPGEAVFIMAMTVFDGDLYAGTYESGGEKTGHVYKFDGERTWIDCGAPDPANSISAMAVYEGQLYAAASHYRAGGSSLDASENTKPGGRIYRYEGDKGWELVGELEGHEAILGLVVYNGDLYASSLYHPAGLYRYAGGTEWVDCGDPGFRCVVLGVWNGDLLSGGYDPKGGGVARYEGDRDWTYLGTPPGVTQTYSFASYFGEHYVGTWPEGKVFRYGGPENWVDVGQLGEEKEVMGMMVYNGQLFGGTLPLAKVYRFDGPDEWFDTGQLDTTPDVKYRRAWTMAIHEGKLFCGVLPSGHIKSLEIGQCVSHGSPLPSGWRHVAAVREGAELKLYVDGKMVAANNSPKPVPDLDTPASLKIGFGPQDHFRGGIKDLRIYSRALGTDEIEDLALP